MDERDTLGEIGRSADSVVPPGRIDAQTVIVDFVKRLWPDSRLGVREPFVEFALNGPISESEIIPTKRF